MLTVSSRLEINVQFSLKLPHNSMKQNLIVYNFWSKIDTSYKIKHVSRMAKVNEKGGHEVR